MTAHFPRLVQRFQVKVVLWAQIFPLGEMMQVLSRFE
jgi:hypothetical protein